ncbi:dihydroxyacetone kinase subunit DhaK [Tabrizicola sp.]|uniref:dihydroxyacetone kinase subunit DhaK n=1 Tax=Tabrizicola sp. TaxID=2005166 RepID=UPI001A59D165|nr:dihydroxyacetone kinase subunit DhaK [Tabrizicola sp.]MBL9075393.1 dihydroxyacetone kinase subunit DhaK [Tabrizicola sp.]
MKQFMNSRESLVTEAIDGLLRTSGGKLARLDGYPHIRVVIRTDWDRAKVALVSGGGSGHEPSHAGFVGQGMLTAAVCGDVFASPSVDAVLAGILAVTGKAGCLLIVKNYTGDRLNFGLAAERARALGRDVEMVIVADDVAIPGAPRPRGLAGTLLVHKVAGHLARAGASLAEVRAAAERAARAVVSIGISLSSCTIPGQPAESRMGPAEVELGLGIHGEPGATLIPLAPVRELAATLAARLETSLPPGAKVALLLNDLGGVPPIEMAIAAQSVLDAMTREVALVFGPERLMTSLDMKGFSVSALPLDEELERALLSEVGPRAWAPGRRPGAVAPLPLPEASSGRSYAASAHPARRAILERIGAACIAAQAELDALDAKIGDGDTGTTLATAARALLRDLDRLPLGDGAALCAAIADRLSTVMGGSSGILLSIFVAAMGARAGEPPQWPAALRAGAVAMQRYGGAQEGDRTLLDALLPAIQALEAGQDLAASAHAAREGAARTAAMTKAHAGRASYVREDALRGVADPGATAVAVILEALART